MPKARTSSGYQIVGKTSDGVTILKPKMSSGRLRELRAKVEQAMIETRQIKSAGSKAQRPAGKAKS